MAPKTKYKLGIIGSGAWPTTLAILLSENGHEVTQWIHRKDLKEELSLGTHTKALPGVVIPKNICFELDLEKTIKEKNGIIVGLPSAHLDQLNHIKSSIKVPVLSITKGLGLEFKPASEVIKESLKLIHISVLSGPNLAKEIAQKKPAATVIGSELKEEGLFWQEVLSAPCFRVYRSKDKEGVEWGGILKNVIAIGAGISDALELGANAKAALITRGLKEMSVMAEALGAQKDTLEGLSGLGDLMATCHSVQSRNYRLGYLLGSGKTLEEAKKEINAAIEGINTTKEWVKEAQKRGVETPIASGILEIILQNNSPKVVIEHLMSRTLKEE